VFNLLVNWFVGVKAKLIAIGIAALVFFGWLLKFKYQAQREGAQKLKDQIEKENKKVTDAWTKIDRSPSNVDNALGRLRKRSRDSGHSP
jgi:hypothetical protein